jgi:hypothetical protein
MKRIKPVVFSFFLMLLILAGCQDLTGPEGPRGAEGEAAVPGPLTFSIGSAVSEPHTNLDTFSSALRNAVNALPPEAGASPENPIDLKIEGLILSQKDHLYVIYGSLNRYTALDLGGCTGTMISAIPNSLYPENKAKVVSLVLPDSIILLEPGQINVSGVFTGFTGLVSVELPGVTVIGDYAFRNCTALSSVKAPRVEFIYMYAFANCVFTTLEFPNLGFVGGRAFEGCTGLGSFSAPKLAAIFNYAFTGCTALEELDFPSLTDLGQSAFQNCTGLKSVKAPRLAIIMNNAFTGCIALEALTLGAAPPELMNTVFSSVGGTSGSPKTITLRVPAGSKTAAYNTWEAANDTFAKLGNYAVLEIEELEP